MNALPNWASWDLEITMPKTDVERLIVRLEASQTKFEKQMKAIDRSANRNANRVEKRFAKMSRNLDRHFRAMGVGFSRGFIGAVAGAASIAGMKKLTNSVSDAVSELSEIGKVADKVGVTTDALQELRVAAELAGVSQRTLDTGLQRFSRRLGEASDDAGVLKMVLQQNNIQLRDAAGNMRPMLEVLKDYADLIKRARSEQERLVLANKAFDTEGAGLVNLFKGGSRRLVDQMAEIKRLGIVIDEELIRRAEKLDDKFELATKVIRVQFLEIMLKLAPAIVDVATAIAKMINGLDALNSRADGMSLGKMEARSKELRSQLVALNQEIKASEAAGSRAGTLRGVRQQVAKEIIEIEAKIPAAQIAERERERFDRMLRIHEFNMAQTQRPVSLGNSSTGGIDVDVKKGLLTLIAKAEGTIDHPRARGFNTTLGYGAFTGRPLILVNKTLREILQIQKGMLAHPNNNFNSSAVGMFQITRRTLKDQISKLGLSLDEMFTPELQTRIATNLAEQRGRDVDGLRKEWQGLVKVADDVILKAFDNTKGFGQERQRQLATSRDQAAVQRQILDGLRDTNREYEFERTLIGMSTSERQRAIAIEETLNELRRAGIPITAELKATVAALASEQGRLAAATEQAAMSTEQQIAAMDEIRGTAKDVLSGFIDDLRNGESASDALWNALRKIEDKLIDLATNSVIDMLFGQGGTTAGGLFGGVGGGLFSLFGFAEGGIVARYARGGLVQGPGTGRSDSVLGIGPQGPVALSNGEFIMTADVTRKFRPFLESLNKGMVPGMAAGGAVGAAAAASGAPVINLRNINLNDPVRALELALSTREGEEVVLNWLGERPGALRGILG